MTLKTGRGPDVSSGRRDELYKITFLKFKIMRVIKITEKIKIKEQIKISFQSKIMKMILITEQIKINERIFIFPIKYYENDLDHRTDQDQ